MGFFKTLCLSITSQGLWFLSHLKDCLPTILCNDIWALPGVIIVPKIPVPQWASLPCEGISLVMLLTVLLALICATKIKDFSSPCKAQYDVSASYMEKMETQEVKWLFQNCRGSEVKSRTEFSFLCSSLYQVVHVGADSWVSGSCWTPYSLGKKNVSSRVTSTGFCSTFHFRFLMQVSIRLTSAWLRSVSWGIRAAGEVTALFYGGICHFDYQESSSEPNYHGKPKYMCCNSPNKCLWRGCAELLLIHPIKSSWLLKKFLSLSRGFRQGRANGCSWVAKGLCSRGREAGKSLPSQQSDAGEEGRVRRGDNADNCVNGNACHSF